MRRSIGFAFGGCALLFPLISPMPALAQTVQPGKYTGNMAYNIQGRPMSLMVKLTIDKVEEDQVQGIAWVGWDPRPVIVAAIAVFASKVALAANPTCEAQATEKKLSGAAKKQVPSSPLFGESGGGFSGKAASCSCNEANGQAVTSSGDDRATVSSGL